MASDSSNSGYVLKKLHQVLYGFCILFSGSHYLVIINIVYVWIFFIVILSEHGGWISQEITLEKPWSPHWSKCFGCKCVRKKVIISLSQYLSLVSVCLEKRNYTSLNWPVWLTYVLRQLRKPKLWFQGEFHPLCKISSMGWCPTPRGELKNWCNLCICQC